MLVPLATRLACLAAGESRTAHLAKGAMTNGSDWPALTTEPPPELDFSLKYLSWFICGLLPLLVGKLGCFSY